MLPICERLGRGKELGMKEWEFSRVGEKKSRLWTQGDWEAADENICRENRA